MRMFRGKTEEFKKRNRESGSVILEACIVFPVIFCVIILIIYLGNVYFQKAQIDSYVQQYAVLGAQCVVNPQLEEVRKTNQAPTKIDNCEPYRYIISALGVGSIGDLEDHIAEEMTKEIDNSVVSFFMTMKAKRTEATNTAKYNNYIVYGTFETNVSYEIELPGSWLLPKQNLDFTSHAEVAVDDIPEFIRNTDMVVDMFIDTELGEKIESLFDKVNDFLKSFAGVKTGGGSVPPKVDGDEGDKDGGKDGDKDKDGGASSSPDPSSNPSGTTSPDPTFYPPAVVSPDPTFYPPAVVSPDPTFYPPAVISPNPTFYPPAVISPNPTFYPPAVISPTPTFYPPAVVSPSPSASKISDADRKKLDSWPAKNRPTDEQYLKYKSVYDNKYYVNQKTGEIIWPGTDESEPGGGKVHTDGFKNGKYESVTIKPEENKIIDRYGSNWGVYFGEDGTPYEQRALSPVTDPNQYNRYQVCKELPVKKGEIAPWFDEPGGGTQYQLDPAFVDEIKKKLHKDEPLIDGLCRLGYLKRL